MLTAGAGETLAKSPKTTEDSISTKKAKVTVTPMIGFQYQHVKERGEMTDYMDVYRDEIDPARAGFANFFENFPQMPSLSLEVLVNPQGHIHSKDEFEMGLYFAFTSSAIFGGKERSQVFQTVIQDFGLELGDSPMTWSQELKHAGRLGIDLLYNPYNLDFGRDCSGGLVLLARGGFAWHRGESILEGEVLNDTVFNNLGGVENANLLGLYKKTRTVTESVGDGGFLDLMGGLKFDLKGFRIDLKGGYRFMWFPDFTMTENRDFDGVPSIVETSIDYEMHGPAAEATLGYEF